MLNLLWILLSIGLIVIIFLRAPQNSGLASFATKSNLLGSPSSAEQTLNNFDNSHYYLFNNSNSIKF